MDNFLTNSLLGYSRIGGVGSTSSTTQDDRRRLIQKSHDHQAFMKYYKEESDGILGARSDERFAEQESYMGSSIQKKSVDNSTILENFLKSPYGLGLGNNGASFGGGVASDDSLSFSSMVSPSLISDLRHLPVIDRAGLIGNFDRNLLGVTNPLLQQKLDMLNALNNTIPSVPLATLQETLASQYLGGMGGTGLDGMFIGSNVGGHEEIGDRYAEHGILGPWSARSASLLGGMALSNKKEKRKIPRKKSKDKPKRPLSAYNIFFKEERSRILDKKNAKAAAAAAKNCDDSSTTKSSSKSGKAKVGFENLAKMIGQRWQNLTSDQVEYYKKEADKDMVRYKKEMEIYSEKQKNKAQQKEEEEEDEDSNAEGPQETGSSEEGPPSKRQKIVDGGDSSQIVKR